MECLIGQNWYATYWEKLKNNPPLLLFGDDIELLEFIEQQKKLKHSNHAKRQYRIRGQKL